ncbi:hypothetical protein U9M48_027290 [Paspalum notatum var. saurae]|uniref:J domain-containing protein n=1 Tax=Paspalum notatum var. saurae TaxID=547442 RepID=A0AAQ3WZY8_PASNO
MNSFEIHPKKGEIWALHKESSLLQSQNTDNHQSFNYDVVEVFNVSMSVGFIVSPLVRIHGFVSLFAEAKDKPHILIPSSELLRFSHSIPCYRTDGSEKVGVEGLIELDTAALPSDLAAAFPSITLDSYMDINKKKVTRSVDVKYPDSEFHNFDEDHPCEKFDYGQVWALYSDTDTFPNLYGWINKVEKEPFKVHLTWLKACPQGVNKHWLEQDIPVSCGEFGIQNLSTEYNETCAFSHLVVTRCQIGTGQQVKILPKVGEVWAIYKNWAPDWVPSSKAHPPEYAIGVIKMCTKTTTLFSFLTNVDGHVSVFKHDVLKGALEVPMEENLRFSHRIPAFRLRKENDGKLCGFYELDPAAVPYCRRWIDRSLARSCCPPASLRPPLPAPLAAAPTSSDSVMDCNKEEALRAKDIALSKLKTKDILGAQRIALRAQRLYPKLEHLPQLLTICEVHCAAEAKVNGNMDWYGILQVEATADEIVIRKQYEKLALLLHHGKNTLPGAQSAFKLVSEAQTILCDHVKRSRYDIKRQRGPQQMSKETTWRSFDTHASKSDGAEHTPPSDLVMVFWTTCPHCWKRFVYYQQNFWIRCDGCRKNFFAFKIHEEVVPSRLLVAAPNNCQVPFEMFSRQRHGVHNPQVKFSKFYTKGKDVDSEPTMHAGQSHERVEQDCSSDGCQEVRCSGTRSEAVECSAINLILSPAPSINKCTPKRMVPDPPDAYCAATHNMSREYASTTLHAAGSNSLERSGKRKQDDGANNSHSGDSCTRGQRNPMLDEHLHSEIDCQRDGNTTQDGTANSGDCEKFDDIIAGADNQSTEHLSNKVDSQGDVKGTCEGNANSGDGKMLSDNVAGSNNQLSEHHCREMGSRGDGDATRKCNANSDTVGDRGNIKSEATDTVGENSCHSECLSLPDRNVFDFEKFRDVNLFAVGQIWALYDNRDGMPRFYARITWLDASDFKVHLAWLEHDAVNEEEEKWTDEELPVACGKFCFRKTRDISRNKSMFSHMVAWTEGEERNSYVIYPIKGDVWALYKGWSMEWSLDADNHRLYEYEVVEVLSNISADGVTVIPLVRIKGFVSLFATAREKIPFTIPSSKLLQFSHRIPFYRTTGDEKVGIPGGFLELDSACLPTDLDAAFPSVTLDSYMSPCSMPADLRTDSMSGRMNPGTDHISLEKNHCAAHLPMENLDISSEQGAPLQKNVLAANKFGDSSLQNCLSPKTFTYPDSSFHNFEELRSHEKFECGQIWVLYADVDKFPKLYGLVNEVEMEPFKACPRHEQEEQWLEQDIAISCGRFLVRDSRAVFDTNIAFSHVIQNRQTSTKWQFEILPQVGEVWAIYMNWSPGWAPGSNPRALYAVGEIRRRTRSSTIFEFLTKVDGYVSVFKPDSQKPALKIPVKEDLRFSHRIPSFLLTEEIGGELLRFYELDPAAVPDILWIEIL